MNGMMRISGIASPQQMLVNNGLPGNFNDMHIFT